LGVSWVNSATPSAAYLAVHAHSPGVVTRATVHGYAVASGWATGSLLLAAIVAGVLIDANPGREPPRQPTAAAPEFVQAETPVRP